MMDFKWWIAEMFLCENRWCDHHFEYDAIIWYYYCFANEEASLTSCQYLHQNRPRCRWHWLGDLGSNVAWVVSTNYFEIQLKTTRYIINLDRNRRLYILQPVPVHVKFNFGYCRPLRVPLTHWIAHSDHLSFKFISLRLRKMPGEY